MLKKKLNVEGKVDKYITQLVAKGYCQVEGFEFGKIFSLVANELLLDLFYLLLVV